MSKKPFSDSRWRGGIDEANEYRKKHGMPLMVNSNFIMKKNK